MSQENVEIVRAGIDAFNRRDLEGVLKDADPDFEFDVSRAVGPVQGVFKLDQTRGLLEEFFGMWEAVRWEIDELREVGDHVAASITSYFRGRDGIEITARTCGVRKLRRVLKPADLQRDRLYAPHRVSLTAKRLRG
jgi:ketosteroid isomerase-like protein